MLMEYLSGCQLQICVFKTSSVTSQIPGGVKRSLITETDMSARNKIYAAKNIIPYNKQDLMFTTDAKKLAAKI